MALISIPDTHASTFTKVIAIIATLATGFYMLPWGIAAVRDVPHWMVFWVNLLLGWTIIGWIVALVMSFRAQQRTVIISTQD
jgi:hypothetical protein